MLIPGLRLGILICVSFLFFGVLFLLVIGSLILVLVHFAGKQG